MNAIRVLLADDHDLFRRGLAEVLEEEDDIEVVGHARDGREAVQRTGEKMPDVIFMDLNMPGQGGIEATAYVTQQWPDIKVLILTVSEEPADLFRALGVGALGYVLRNAAPKDIVDALRNVNQGYVIVSPHMAPRFLAELSQGPDARTTPQAAGGMRAETQLTLKEQEILQHVSRGLSNAQIAGALTVSENTVKTHIKNILGKLHSKNRSEAVAYAARFGFLQTGPDPTRP